MQLGAPSDDASCSNPSDTPHRFTHALSLLETASYMASTPWAPKW